MQDEEYIEVGLLTIGDGGERWLGLPQYRIAILEGCWIELASLPEGSGEVQRHATMHSLLFGLLTLVGVRARSVRGSHDIGTLAVKGIDYRLTVVRQAWLNIEKEPGLRFGSFEHFEDVIGALRHLVASAPPLPEALESTLRNLAIEITRSRQKYPSNVDLLAALQGEAGELARALLRSKSEGCDPMLIYAEAIQTAAVALRIAEEGDPGFPYRFTESVAEDFAVEDDRW